MRYHQEKKQKNGNIISDCEIEFESDVQNICFNGKFSRDYIKKTKKYSYVSVHKFILNKDTGDITITNTISAHKDDGNIATTTVTKVNNFEYLHNFVENGFYNGDSDKGYWGINHTKEVKKYYNRIKSEIVEFFIGTYLENKDYLTPVVSPFFDLLVDYHVIKKGIKVHNNIYNDILMCYPKTKWLKLNNNKFLPSVLDEYGIKTSYLVTELSTNSDKINVSSLIFLVKLFGDNYVDYIRNFDWKSLLNDSNFRWTEFFECKDDSEKKCLSTVFSGSRAKDDRVLKIFYELFKVRKLLEEKGCFDLKIKGKTFNDINLLSAKWGVIKRQTNIGYKLKYEYPDDFLETIQQPIIVNDKTFIPVILLTEEDFAIEGIIMNNCMGTQFPMGTICLFISLQMDKKRVNIQYKDGKIIQSFTKANTPVPQEIFGEAISELTTRINNHGKIVSKRIKYDVADF
jgi:hypothetical protein